MDSVIQSISKPFTRYFMPGLVFTFFSILLPTFIFYPKLFNSSSVYITYGNIITLSLVLGYLLDSAGFYKWTMHLNKYKNAKIKLVSDLNNDETNKINSNDPDVFITKLWKDNEKMYDRIMIERAEWVLVLETAFALIFSSIILLSLCIVHFEPNLKKILLFILPIIFLLLSYLTSSKGIQRMEAHNSKLVHAISGKK